MQNFSTWTVIEFNAQQISLCQVHKLQLHLQYMAQPPFRLLLYAVDELVLRMLAGEAELVLRKQVRLATAGLNLPHNIKLLLYRSEISTTI